MQLLRFPDLVERRIVRNRVTLSRLIQNEGFPAGFKLGPNTRVWNVEDVDAWLEARAAASVTAA